MIGVSIYLEHKKIERVQNLIPLDTYSNDQKTSHKIFFSRSWKRGLWSSDGTQH